MAVAVCGSGHARGKPLQHTLNHLGRLPYGKAVSGLAGDNQMTAHRCRSCLFVAGERGWSSGLRLLVLQG